MANRTVAINEFLEIHQSGLDIIDVRTPDEFNSGHIPGAINIPLFNNNERKIIGTLYKQEGKNPAILEGLNFVGPKMKDLADQVLKYVKNNQVLIHCARGGMRSSSVAWLMNLLGVETITLQKGYKAFRRYVLDTFSLDYKLIILGGWTGSAKTEILGELKSLGEQVIDLEFYAEHKGSAFGELAGKQNITQEMFENLVATELRSGDISVPFWFEDESRLIGRIVIPDNLWKKMREARAYFIEVPLADRINFLDSHYGKSENIEEIKNAIFKIKSRLGDRRFQSASWAIESGNLQEAIQICLEYYDRAYEFGLSKRTPGTINKIKFDSLNIPEISEILKKDFLCQK